MILARAASRSSWSAEPGSLPRMMFSSTVKLSASLKCWCTMPMPAPMASAGLWKVTGSPSISMVPSSGFCIP